MAEVAEFIRELAVKAKARKKDPKVLEGLGGKDIIENVLTQRQGTDKNDTVRIAYEKARSLYMPTINVALAAGDTTNGDVAKLITAAESNESWEDWKSAADNISLAHDMARTVIAGRKKEYETARSTAMGTISNAMGMTEIGGGAVASGLKAADALANAGKWSEAKTRLDKVEEDARKVNERAPFVRACRRHQDTIKAAFAITHKNWGKEFKVAWKKALQTAESGAYETAASEVEELAKRVEKAKNDKELKSARDEIVTARKQNVEAMKTQLTAEVVDVTALRQLVLKEIGGGEEQALATRANELGDDPGAKSRESIGDEASAERQFMNHDWFKLKERLHDERDEFSADDMWDCWRYRQSYVTQEIDKLRKKFPTLIAKTSGSTDLESDIAITFAASTPGEDVLAAREFNAVVKGKFGKPPGRVFDVNIYPRGYNAISESINPDYNVNPIPDQNIDQPTDAMQKLSRVDQDVATLLKQRRFLDDKSFQEFMDSVVAGVSDSETKRQIKKQFEEGEDIYLLTAFEKVDRIGESLQKAGKPLPPLLEQFNSLRNKGGKGDQASVEQAQRLLPKVLDELEQAYAAEVMETTDEMYLDKMARLREDQARIGRLENPGLEPGEHHDGSCDDAHKGQDHDGWRKAETQRLKAQVKKDQFTNIVFANEAYMSQGAIEHVVAGIQAKDPEQKAIALAELTPATLMQSCNEQLADFFKDMKSSEQEIGAIEDETKKRRVTGEAFVHASKYLVRLLDAAQILSEKFEKFEPPVALEFGLMKVAKTKTPRELMTRVEAVLLALRKSSTVPAEAKGEVGVDEVRQLFGVTGIKEFRKLIADFGVELNQKVRSNPEFKSELAVDQQTEREYLGVPAMPEDLKSLLSDVPSIVNASLGDSSVNRTLGEADGEIQLMQELLDDIPGGKSLPEYLRDRIEEAVIRAEHVLSTLKTSDIKSVLRRADSVVRDAQIKIRKLREYNDDELHDAYRVDITQAVSKLAEKIQLTTEVKAEVQQELKSYLLALDQKIAELKKLRAGNT